MSSLPGYDLEALLMWNFDLVVVDRHEANPSLGMAEMLGTIPQRRMLTEAQFAHIVAIYEEVRERAEWRLSDFDEETQSWRDYAGFVFDDILTEERHELAMKYLNQL